MRKPDGSDSNPSESERLQEAEKLIDRFVKIHGRVPPVTPEGLAEFIALLRSHRTKVVEDVPSLESSDKGARQARKSTP